MCIRARLNYSKFAVFVTCSHGIKCDVSINLFRTKTGQGPGIIKISIASSHAFNFYFLSSRWPAGGFCHGLDMSRGLMENQFNPRYNLCASGRV